MDAAHRRANIYRRQQHQHKQLRGIAIRQTKQHMQAITHLRGKETNRANGTRHNCDNTQGINHPTDPAGENPLTKHRIKQSARLQRLT